MLDMKKMVHAFGIYLKGLRNKRGMTLRDVEVKAKISNAFLSQIERGERGIPTFKVLLRLATAYGVKVSDMVKVIETAGGDPEEESTFTFNINDFKMLSPEERNEINEWIRFKLTRLKPIGSTTSKTNKSKI